MKLIWKGNKQKNTKWNKKIYLNKINDKSDSI